MSTGAKRYLAHHLSIAKDVEYAKNENSIVMTERVMTWGDVLVLGFRIGTTFPLSMSNFEKHEREMEGSNDLGTSE